MPLIAEKAALRQQMKQVRADLSESARVAAGQGLVDHIFAVRDFIGMGAPNVAGYAPLDDELDPRPLMTALRDGGAQTLLPVMNGKDQPLTFHLWDGIAPLLVGDFDVRQPVASAPAFDPDIILAPLLAADQAGGRLGYGGGFYDRTIAGLKSSGQAVKIIGLAYQGQLVNKVPSDELDQRLDAVLTPDGLIAIG